MMKRKVVADIINIDKIVEAYHYFTESTEARQAEGSWLGIFKEYDDGTKKFIISNESVNLKTSMLRLDRIFGSIDTTAPVLRHHDISGSVKNEFLITEYQEANPSRGGAVVYLLKGSVSSGTMQGFWTGYDPDEREVMSCPYILTRQTNPVEAQAFFKDWLNKECAGKKKERTVRRKVSARNWRYPARMTFTQWRRLPYRQKHWLIAQAQCDLLGYWRDCAKLRCRRARGCQFPQPCYWDRKQATPPAEWAKADARCKPLRELMRIGSTKGSEGLWLF